MFISRDAALYIRRRGLGWGIQEAGGLEKARQARKREP